MSLAELISRHALEIVLAAFVAIVGTIALGLVLLKFAWRHRQFALSLIGRLVRASRRYFPFSWLVRRLPAPFSRFGQRLTTIEFLGVYLAGGLCLALALVAFLSLATDVVRASAIVDFDRSLATALQETMTPEKLARLSLVTTAGSGAVLTVVGVLVGMALLLRKQWSVLIGWGFTLLGGGVLNAALKSLFRRVRPEYSTLDGWSFPSGHAMGSFICYGMLAYLALVFLPRRFAIIAGALLLLITLFIGFTRIYLGQHYFSDVIAGYAGGAVWLAVTISGTEIARLNTRKRGRKSERAEPPVLT